MKNSITLLTTAAIVFFMVLTSCKKSGVQADVDTAIAQQNYQFIALLDDKGKWTYPDVPGVPDWYFQTTGIVPRLTKSDSYDADLAYMKSYNDSLYQALKAQGKFQVVEENIARVKANLDKYKAATNSAAKKN